ncbi:hypothetical protein LIER_38099 [Lithospermum erythrorhizon]|uniref:Uncharacterized protein n=1 Tax=Lithospermum erythrorhizon TaxID=34254 RepID=A0AAV3PX36_LITER
MQFSYALESPDLHNLSHVNEDLAKINDVVSTSVSSLVDAEIDENHMHVDGSGLKNEAVVVQQVDNNHSAHTGVDEAIDQVGNNVEDGEVVVQPTCITDDVGVRINMGIDQPLIDNDVMVEVTAIRFPPLDY